MFVASVFVEIESWAYIVISLEEECIFPLYLCSLCTCIPSLTQRHCHFRLCVWAESWYRKQSKKKGSWIKDVGRSFPTKPQIQPQLVWTKPSVWDQGRINEHCSWLAAYTVDETATSDTGSGGMWPNTEGESTGPSRYWTMLSYGPLI